MDTINIESLRESRRPLYLALADAIANRIADGRLGPDERLPTHRALAWDLGVNIGTVSRAFAELERRGLIVGEVGRGTFVRPTGDGDLPPLLPPDHADGVIDLSLNYPPAGAERSALRETLHKLADDRGAAYLLDYQPHVGRPGHRAAGAAWLARGGIAAPSERVLVTAGAQHGTLVALAAATRPGDRIAAEELTHPGLLAIARMQALRVEPMRLDDEGCIPDSFEEACRAGIKAAYFVPTLQNPTTAVMSSARRRDIMRVAAAHDVVVIEDDLFGYLHPDPPPPLAAIAPDHAIYVTSLSKTVAPGLRTGYLVPPPRLFDEAALAIRTTCWMAPPMSAEIASRWIADGTAERVLQSHQQEAAARLDIARTALAGSDFLASDGALHVWLRLPESWRGGDFVAEARAADVLVASDLPFAVGRSRGGQAIRLCLGPVSDRDRLREGLSRIGRLLERRPAHAAAIL